MLWVLSASASDVHSFDGRATGDWHGARSALSAGGLNLSLSYISEWLQNSSGGARTTSAYADQIAFGADLDLATLFGWRGGSLHSIITNRNGPQLDARADFGTLLETHEIFGRGHYTRLTRFYLQQDLLGDRVTFRIGRSDVDFFPFSCDFVNISFCGALPGYHSNGWYTWPIGQYFANLTLKPVGRSYVKVGASDVNPRNLQGDQGLRLHTRDSARRGTLANVEVGWLPNFGEALSGAYRIGLWHDSTNYPDLLLNQQRQPMPIAGGEAMLRDSSSGYYALAQQQLTRNGADGGLAVFANFSRSDSDVNKVDRLLSLGLWYTGAIPARPHDRIGVALGHSRVSRSFRGVQRLANESAGVRGANLGAEMPIEVNYCFAGARGFALMPSVQYVKDAGGRRDEQDIWIFGAKLTADF